MNILVVQAERLALDHLLEMLQFYAGPHRIDGFLSASEALAHAESAQVDLLITGITMPEGIDGLELIRQLKAWGRDFAAILLSSHSEFAYVRAALRLGAVDYLTKPVRTDELQEAVDRALAGHAEAQAERERAHEAELSQLLMGAAGQLSGQVPADKWGLILIVCENWQGATTWQATPVDHSFIRTVLRRDVRNPCDIVDLDGRRRVILVPPVRAHPQEIEMLAMRLHQRILAAGVIVHTACDSIRVDEQLDAAMRRVSAHLEATMRLEAPTFVPLYAYPDPAAASISSESTDIVARLLAQGKVSSALTEVYRALDELQRCAANQPIIVETLGDLFAVLRRYARGKGLEQLPAREVIVAAVRSCRTYAELAVWVGAQTQSLVVDPPAGASPRQLVRKLVALAQVSYASDISLPEFAIEHGVSRAYFSRLFKEEMGIVFSDYLTQVRIAKAKDLLARRDLRLADISALVGYDDPKYFGQVFRQVAGVSPLEYRQSRQADVAE